MSLFISTTQQYHSVKQWLNTKITVNYNMTDVSSYYTSTYTFVGAPPPRPPYLWHPPQPCSPSYSHDGQSCLRRHKLQHWGQRAPGCARWPLFFIHQTLQGPRCQQLTQLGQHRLRATVIHLEGEKKKKNHRGTDRDAESGLISAAV